MEVQRQNKLRKVKPTLEAGASSKAATFRPAYPQHAGSNYPQGILRVEQAIFQRTRVVRGYQIFGLFLEIQRLYKIRVSKDKLPALLFKP